MNDIRRTTEVVARGIACGAEMLDDILEGRDFDNENFEAVARSMAHRYPLAKKHLVVDPDTSTRGVWHMTAEQTQKVSPPNPQPTTNTQNFPCH